MTTTSDPRQGDQLGVSSAGATAPRGFLCRNAGSISVACMLPIAPFFWGRLTSMSVEVDHQNLKQLAQDHFNWILDMAAKGKLVWQTDSGEVDGSEFVTAFLRTC